MDEINALETLNSFLVEATTNPGYLKESEDNIFVESETFDGISKFYSNLINDVKSIAIDLLDDSHDYMSDISSSKYDEKNKSAVDKLLEKCVYYKSHHIVRAEVNDYSRMREDFSSYIRRIDSLSKNIIYRKYDSVDRVESTLKEYKNTLDGFDRELKDKKESSKYMRVEEIEKILIRSKDKANDVKDQTDDLFHIITSFGKKSLQIKKEKSDDPIDSRRIWLFNTCASKTYKFMNKWIQFFYTHEDIHFE